MTTNVNPTDSAATTDLRMPSPAYPCVEYPPYSQRYLRELLSRLNNLSAGDLMGVLPSLNEPTLYAVAAVISLDKSPFDDIAASEFEARLREELRLRECRTMGIDPAGPVRRGRLIQLAATCTTLSVAGVSSLQRHTLLGHCPFCNAHEFRLFLGSVRWRCFGCNRGGALLEFAEQLLETRPTRLPLGHDRPPPA